jgi:hypothetical protein
MAKREVGLTGDPTNIRPTMVNRMRGPVLVTTIDEVLVPRPGDFAPPA